ncbi:TPA: hypothetical protein JBF68_14790 [Legionella pneumophila]|nr:hypothetical protein [Legionella pneumophila]HAU0358582.1 hypothetical protein [Legionella pneumophila]HAU0567130.1 hypothetical protein [Legionella pneumophila]
MKAKQETSSIEQKILDNLKAEVVQSPLIEKQDDGLYQVTFWTRLSDIDTLKDGCKLEFSVYCPDLDQKMLDDLGNPKIMNKVQGNTGLYYLTINNVPIDTFATYYFNKKIGDNPIPERVDDQTNTNSKPILKFNINESKVIQQETACIQLNPKAELPNWATIHQLTQMKGEVTHAPFKDDNEESPDYTPFPARDLWVYKPEGFDKLTPNDRKIIFMLDGKDFCESLTPYIDGKGEPFANTAIVFIAPGEYTTPGPPGRVREYYYRLPDFSKLLAEKLIPKYRNELSISSKDNLTLAAHSLAAFPMMDVAKNYPDLVGGLVLVSPALNQVGELLPLDPNPEFKKIPLYMQIGEKENDKPPVANSDPTNDNYRHLKGESRLDSNKQFHATLVTQGYNVTQALVIHPFGHDSKHMLEGLTKGMQFINESRIIERCRQMKGQLQGSSPDLEQSVTMGSKVSSTNG